MISDKHSTHAERIAYNKLSREIENLLQLQIVLTAKRRTISERVRQRERRYRLREEKENEYE
jgi:hypothetical protein